MLRFAFPVTLAVLAGGCARSSTTVLEPYALADGTMFQDVVTIAADENGTAPVVTQTKTFELRTGYKGAAGKAKKPVATASGSGPGFVASMSGAVVSAAIPAATGLIIAKNGWNRTTINNTNSNNANAANSNTIANTVANTNRNTNSNANTNNNANNNSNSNANANTNANTNM